MVIGSSRTMSFYIVARRMADAFLRRGVPAIHVIGDRGAHIFVEVPPVLAGSRAMFRFGDVAIGALDVCVDRYIPPSPFVYTIYVNMCGRHRVLGWAPDPMPHEFFERPPRRIDTLLVYIPEYPLDIKNREWWVRHGEDIYRIARSEGLAVVCKTKWTRAPHCDEHDAMRMGNDVVDLYSRSILLWLSKREGFGMPPYEALALGSIAVIPYASYIPIVGYPYQYQTMQKWSPLLGTYWYPSKSSLTRKLLSAIESSGDTKHREELRRFAYWAHESVTVASLYIVLRRNGLLIRRPRFLPEDAEFLKVGLRLLGLSPVAATMLGLEYPQAEA